MIPYASSGTRLEAIGYADEGAVFFDTMHDEHLSADCVYEQTEAGDWVCAPTLQRSLIYLDADCTQPAVEEQPFTESTGEVFSLSDGTGRSGADTVLVPKHTPAYRVTDEIFKSDGSTTYAEDTLSIYVRSTATQCTGPRLANRHVVVVPPSIFRVTPLDDDQLVKATVRHLPLQNQLSLQRLVTDDGSQLSGHVEHAGRECEIQRDGRCVPEPVAKPFIYADPDCKEWSWGLATPSDPSLTIYGVQPTNDVSSVYELTPTTTVYSQETKVEMVTVDGQTMIVEVVVGCNAMDVSSSTTLTYYRRSREVTDQIPKLDTVQLGAPTSLSPIWFFGLAPSNTRVQIQIHSPDGDWVKPNIRTSDGSVCAVYYSSYKDTCLLKDGVTRVPVSEVRL